MSMKLLVDFNEFWSRLRADIKQARRSVFVQTFAFEGDSVGQDLAAALQSSPATDKRVLADSFTRVVLNDRFRYWPANLLDRELRAEARATSAMMARVEQSGTQVKFTNPYGLTPRKLLSRNHKKLIVIDENVAYFGGINFSEHNAAWHDMMFRTSDPEAVAFLRRDFMQTWSDNNSGGRKNFAGLEILTANGANNRSAFQRIFELIESARHTIFVESPYVTFPFYERLRAATRRGVAVTVLTPRENNWRVFANYARLESARSGIDLRLFAGGMSHLKAMLIDDDVLVAGSSNFDYLSYRIHQELIAIITEPATVHDFRERVLRIDLANALPVECHASAISQRWLNWQTKVIDAAMTALT